MRDVLIDTMAWTSERSPPAQAAASSARTGFTLLELLIVIAILALLSSMLFPLVAIAKRQAKVANTRATMLKVDQAIRQFRTDMRVYPWQIDLGTAPAEASAWSNNLAWRLAWNPPPAGSGTPAKPDKATYIGKVQQDLSALGRCFTFVNGCNVPPSGDRSEGTHAFRNEFQTGSSKTNLLPANGTLQFDTADVNAGALIYLPGTARLGNDCSADARALTQIAEEVTKLVYLAGQMPVLAPSGIDATQAADKARAQVEDERYPTFTVSSSPKIPYRYLPYNKAGYYGDDSRGPALTSAAAQAQGWRGDYLTAALKTDRANGQRADVDASGEAIVDAWGHPLVYVCSVRPGVHGQLQALSASLYNGAREERYNMAPQGRAATSALASDIRTTAAQPYVLEFELWSAGPDGQFAGSRDATANRDNVALLPYLKGLQ